MNNKIKQLFENSFISFYLKNIYWNFHFWLFCKKQFKKISYIEYHPNKLERQRVEKKRFLGYLYKNRLYYDNPGMDNIKKTQWFSWKKKGLIK